MAKIGRNDPCPCGSGKKYKKCCIDKATPLISAINRNHHWFLEEIEEFTTEDIISQLRTFGVRFDEAQFQKDVRRFYSAEKLADNWEKEFAITASGLDVDFIWMACTVLWKRLAPDVINSERLDDMMQEGYTLLQPEGPDKTTECCNLWLQVWDHLKPRFTEDMKSIEDAENVFNGMQCLSNWCQDLEMELLNAGGSDPSFYQKRIDYCREFCSLFPESSELVIFNMKRAEAESYFFLGETEQGDQAFQALIEEFPDNAWGYIGWGDMYSIFCPRHIEKNLKKAREIYEMALGIDSEERKHVVSRLESLDKQEMDESSERMTGTLGF
jgi:tetratricopeptide (TPR) repeat protein